MSKLIFLPYFKKFSAVVTKIELNANATVLHFLIKQSRGKYVRFQSL
jgi:hypothetical protein